MVPLANGQAIIGGETWAKNNVANTIYAIRANIYFLTCTNLICTISTLSQELKNTRMQFVAIPLPDDISGCIFEGKKCIF